MIVHRLISISMSIFSLLIIHFYSTMIKTNLVVLEDPKIWKSYDDLIKDGAKPVFIEQFDNHRYFKDADPSSSARRLWDWAVAKFGEKEIIVPAAPKAFRSVGIIMIHRQGVGFFDELMAKMIRETACNQRKVNVSQWISPTKALSKESDYLCNNYNLLITKEKNAKKWIKGLVFNKLFKSREAFRLLAYMQTVIEMGFINYYINFITDFDLGKTYRDPSISSVETLENVRLCKSDFVVRPQAHSTDVIKLSNIRTLAILCLWLLIFASFRLVIETYYSRIRLCIQELWE